MKNKIAVEVIAFLFIVLFLYTAGTKLTGYATFVAQIGKSPLLTHYSEFIAWVIPTVEILAAIMLIIPRTKLLGMYASFGLMLLFTLYVAAILTFSKELPCSCGGVISLLGWKSHLVFNIGFALLALVGVALINKQNTHNKAIQA